MAKKLAIPRGTLIYQTEGSLDEQNPYFIGKITVPENRGFFEEDPAGEFIRCTDAEKRAWGVFVFVGPKGGGYETELQAQIDKQSNAKKKAELEAKLTKYKGETRYKKTASPNLQAFVAGTSNIRGTHSPKLGKVTSSGVTVGLGFDIGTMNVATVEKALKAMGIPSNQMPVLLKQVGKRAVAAMDALLEVQQAGVTLSRQQSLALLDYESANREASIIKKFGSYTAKLFPPLFEILMKMQYALPGNATTFMEKLFEGSYKDIVNQSNVDQCTTMINALNATGQKDYYIKYATKIRQALNEGVEVTRMDRSMQLGDVLGTNDLDNQFADFMSDMKGKEREEIMIKPAQQALKGLGLYSGAVDGKITHLTDKKDKSGFIAALKKFQEQNGLEQNGKLDSKTNKMLMDKGLVSMDKLLGDKAENKTDPNPNPSPNPNPNPNPTPNNPPQNNDKPNNDGGVNYLELFNTVLKGTGNITGTVGKGGDNKPQDVVTIKALLAKHGYLNAATILAPLMAFPPNPLAVFTCDPATIAAIEKFQKEVRKSSKPDGLVEPGKKTLAALNGAATPKDENPPKTDDTPKTDPPNTNGGGGGNNTPPQNNPPAPQAGDKDVVLAPGVIQLITEGNVTGGKFDTRIPQYPQNVSYFRKVEAGTGDFVAVTLSIGVFKQQEGGDYLKVEDLNPNKTQNESLTKGDLVLGTWLSKGRVGSSGVTIGQGYDLGAKYDKGDKAAAKKRMLDANIDPAVAEELSTCVGIQGAPASILASQLRQKGLKITQDNVLSLLSLCVPDYGDKNNFSGIHPALADVCRGICYARGDGGANKDGQLRAMLDAARNQPPLVQCDKTIEWLEHFKTDGGEVRYKDHIKHVQKIKAVIQNGGDVLMSPKPLTMDDLMMEDNPLADWVGDVRGDKFKDSVKISRVQQVLIENKFLPPTYTNKKNQQVTSADGSWGKNTEAALKEYQKANKIPETGKIDEATMQKMFGKTFKSSKEQGSTPPKQDSNPPSNNNNSTPADNSTDDITFEMPDAVSVEIHCCFH